jgi:two-component system, LuxR family, sensor kinase FixL
MRGISGAANRAAKRRRTHLGSRINNSTVESEQRLRAIVDTAVDAIITIDEGGIIESANASAERVFGYAPEELIGQNVNILMPSPHREAHDGYLRRYITTGEAKIIGTGREVIGQRKDGSKVPIHLSISEVPLTRGRLFTAIIHDISERRRLEKEVLEATAREQERIGRELHDGVCQNLVGTALAVSALAKRLAPDAPAAAERAEQLAAIIRQTATQVRDLSHGLSPLQISAGGLTHGLQELARQITETSGVRCAFAGSNHSEVSYDPATATHLYRIAQEAVNNAVRHAKATTVHVQLDRDERNHTLAIRDNGSGFPRRIGNGLGLQTMAYRARVIGGALSIEPAAGGGTNVRCMFHPNHCRERGTDRPRAQHAATRRASDVGRKSSQC